MTPPPEAGKAYRLDDYCAFEIVPWFGNQLTWYCAWRRVSEKIGYPAGYRQRGARTR